MKHIGVMEFVWLRLRRLPRSVWIGGALALLLVPALLIWMLLSLLGGAWQTGSAMLGQGREALQTVLPAEIGKLALDVPTVDATLGALQDGVQQRVQAETERLRAAIPASAEALQQELAGDALPAATEGLRQFVQQGRASADQALSSLLAPARPSTDVSGEDPPGVARLPGFVRTAFARDGSALRVSWVGAAPHAEVVAYYSQQLRAAGYRVRVVQAAADAQRVEFSSPQGTLTLDARNDGHGGSELVWEMR